MQSLNLRVVGILVLLPFAVLTGVAINVDGNDGFSNAITLNLLSLQIWLDLVIAMIFWVAWLLRDARAHGQWPWLWVIAAFLFGAFAPLLYMIVYQRWPATVAGGEEAVGEDALQRRKTLGIILLIGFAAVTVAGLLIDGTDIAGTVTHSWSNIQIWVDLVIVILLWVPWMFQDAKAHGQNPWGWLVFAMALGAFSPLLYLVLYGRWPASHPVTKGQ